MSTWKDDELRKIVESDDLHIAPFREDGTTYGTLTWIWSVEVDGALIARAYNGTTSTWYKAAIKQKAGQITAAGKTFDVTFDRVDDARASAIDAAYRKKYSGSPYLDSMISERARAATIVIYPRSSSKGDL